MCLMVLHKNKTAITSDKDSMIPKIQLPMALRNKWTLDK